MVKNSSTLVWAAHALLLGIAVTPILVVAMPPLVDLPNHMARWHILANIDRQPLISENYQIIPTITPYLLLDFIITPVVNIIGIYDTARAFSVFNFVIIYIGLILVHKYYFNHLDLWPALSLPLIYNAAFMWGFMNFIFATGLMIFFLLMWLRVKNFSATKKFLILTIQCFILYFSHILILGLYGLIVCTHAVSVSANHDGGDLRKGSRDVALTALPFFMTFLIFLTWFTTDDGTGTKGTRYGLLREKFLALMSPTWVTETISDVLLFLVYALGAIFLLSTRRLQIAPAMTLPLLSVAVLCIVFPTQLLGVDVVDRRFLPILAMLGIALTCPKERERKLRLIIPFLATAMVVIRVLSMWGPFQTTDRQFAEFRSAMADLDPGSRILTTHDENNGQLELPLRTIWHWGSIAVIEAQVFDPMLFTGVTQIRATEKNRDIDTGCGGPIATSDLENGIDPDFIHARDGKVLNYCWNYFWVDWPDRFDYLIRIDPTPLPVSFERYVEERRQFSFFEVIEIRK